MYLLDTALFRVRRTIRPKNMEKLQEAPCPNHGETAVSVPNGARNSCVSENIMKRRLRYFFMNPIEKWKAKSRLPWKLLIQILKIFIVTAQVSMFAQQRYDHVGYLTDTKVSLSHLFVKGWDPTREVNVYPPSAGPLAIYQIQPFYDAIDFAIKSFSTVEKTAMGTYKYDKKNGTIVMPTFCYSQYKNGSIDLYNKTFMLNKEIVKRCVEIPLDTLDNSEEFSSQKYLAEKGHIIRFDFLIHAMVTIRLRTIRLTLELPFQPPECYLLENVISYDNEDHDGQMIVDSTVTAFVLQCDGLVNSVNEAEHSNLARNMLNGSTLIVCLLSFLMCSRSLKRGYELRGTTNKFFFRHFGRKLTKEENFEFTNLWYVLICVSDVLIIVGSAVKIALESQDYEGFLDKWNYCALLLGIGNLLVWLGCLRYLGFFTTYNVLILTIKSCFPNVLRYSVCIMMVFAGYSLCGWLVLGPYNLKFRSLSSTSECLFSLINGDDMFATFASTTSRDAMVWWFSRIYLYTFISLFIYVILSLFIAIITDSYETIKNYYQYGFPLSGLMQFAKECDVDVTDGTPWDDEETTIHDLVNSIFCCCNRFRKNAQYEQLPS